MAMNWDIILYAGSISNVKYNNRVLLNEMCILASEGQLLIVATD